MLAAVVVVPLLLSFYSSFTPFRLTKPETFFIFIGFRNYVDASLTDWEFWVAFGRTVLLLTIALNLEMLLGLGLALLVEKATRGQRVLRTMMMFPMMFSPILVGFQFKFMFNDNIGLVNNALQALGLTDQRHPLADRRATSPSSPSSSPRSGRRRRSSRSSSWPDCWRCRSEPIEAARVDGCTPWQTFRYVTWPFVMPFAYIAMTIRSLDVARAYDIVKIMTDGGPAKRTELLWTLVARTGYSDARMGLANAMAYFSILLSILFTVYFFRKLAAAREQIGAEW